MNNTLCKIENYTQLVQAKHSDLWEDMCANGYAELGECYTLLGDGSDSNEQCIEIDYLATTTIVNMGGSDARCHTDERVVCVAKDGTVWINSDDLEEYFY